MQENIVLEYDAFIRSIKRNQDISHSILTGAGASISSGIQSAGDCIWEWKMDIFLSKNAGKRVRQGSILSNEVESLID